MSEKLLNGFNNGRDRTDGIGGQKPWTQDNNYSSQKGNYYICFDCGRKYLTEKQMSEEGHAVTAHNGVCCECSNFKAVTHIRAFNYLRK